MLSLNKSVDSILAAANRLEQVMDAEAKYWEDVLSVREQGWAVSYATRTSQFERQNLKKTDGTLTVRFGFSECKEAPESLQFSLLISISCSRISKPRHGNLAQDR